MPKSAAPRRHHQRGPGDDGHHARPHLRARADRSSDPLGYARLRSRGAGESARRGDHHERRHRRRSHQRQLVRRHPGVVRAGPGDRGRDDDRRDRGSPRGRCRAVREGADDQAGGRVRRRPHRAQGPPHGARRRDHLGVRRHGRGESGDHAIGRADCGAEPRRARGHRRPRAPPAAVAAGDGAAVSAGRSGRPVVVVTRRLPDPVEEQVSREFDARLNPSDKPLSATELADALRGADALLPTVTDRLTADVLAAEPLRARIIANYGVGFNHIDTASAKARGLVVTNTPDVLTDDTADDAIMLMLMVARRGGEGDRYVRAGAWTGWRPTHMLGIRVSGKTLGLVGLGRIGRAVAHRAHHGFGMRVIFHDPYPPPAAVLSELGAEPRASVDDVLREADFVSLHSPATPETRHLIDARRLALMKRGAFLVNNARGDIVDEAALVAALKQGTIAGAGLDVFEREPAVTPDLLQMDNVVLLPHLGSATHETRVAMGLRALDNLKAFFAGAPPRDRVA